MSEYQCRRDSHGLREDVEENAATTTISTTTVLMSMQHSYIYIYTVYIYELHA